MKKSLMVLWLTAVALLGIILLGSLARGATTGAGGISPPAPPPYGSLPSSGAPAKLLVRAVARPIVTDTDPSTPRLDKAMVIVRHADGRHEGYLMRPALIPGFVNALPTGDALASVVPPPSIFPAVSSSTARSPELAHK